MPSVALSQNLRFRIPDATGGPVPARVEQVALPAGPASVEKLHELEDAIASECEQFEIDERTSHRFCDGVYSREFRLMEGEVVVSKIHKKENFFLLIKGEVTLTTDDGPKRIKAPFMMVTTPGTKRALYAHSDSVMLTFHPNPTNEQDPDLLEPIFIIPESRRLKAPDRKALEEKE